MNTKQVNNQDRKTMRIQHEQSQRYYQNGIQAERGK